MKQPIVKTRKNVLGRDVKITKTGNKKTREVTGNYVSKTRTATDTKGGKKVTKSRIEVDPAMGYGSVRNVTKFTGAAGLKRALSSKPGAVRKTVYDMKAEVDPKRAKQSGTKMSVRELAQTKYKGGNLPRKFKN
jgi:hypothetical protein